MFCSDLFLGSPKSLKITIYTISGFKDIKYVVPKLWGQEKFDTVQFIMWKYI